MRITSLLLLTLLGCGEVPPANYPTAPPQEVNTVPVLGIGDVIEITVYNGQNARKASYKIDPAGKISLQFIGEVIALDKTPTALKEEIQSRLADGYLVDPIVSITIAEINSLNLSVSGEIAKDGKIKYVPGMTIVDAIAMSGGFTPMAKKNHVKVIRQLGDKELTYRIPVAAIQDGNRPNFFVAAGDRIFVPERMW